MAEKFLKTPRAYVPELILQIYRGQPTLEELLDVKEAAKGERIMKAIREIARG